MDKTDIKILNVISQNSRLSVRDIGQKVGVAAITALKRKKAMEKSGVIKKYTVQIDHEELGYDLTVMFRLQFARGKLRDAKKVFAPFSFISSIYEITGDYDLVAVGKFKTRKELEKFLQRLDAVEYITRVESTLVIKTLREDVIEVE
ncbi:Lrp/AsnC family transcriptional regulator [Nanoarchaeota archaeon]